MPGQVRGESYRDDVNLSINALVAHFRYTILSNMPVSNSIVFMHFPLAPGLDPGIPAWLQTGARLEWNDNQRFGGVCEWRQRSA